MNNLLPQMKYYSICRNTSDAEIRVLVQLHANTLRQKWKMGGQLNGIVCSHELMINKLLVF